MTLKRNIIFSFIFLLFSGCTNDMSETDKIRGSILAQFSKEMRKKGFDPNGLGGGQKNGKINLVEITLGIDQLMDINMARKLIVESTNSLFSIINSHKEYSSYFECFPIDIKILHIGFIGQKSEKQCSYDVEYVSIANGKIFYDIDSKVPRLPPLITIHEETFEEAQKILNALCQSDLR